MVWTLLDFETKTVLLRSGFWNFTWSLSTTSSWLLSNHQFGNKQICNQWPGKWWGCTSLLIWQVGLAPPRVVWGWCLAFQKLTTPRPPHKESRRSGSRHKSAWPPSERRQQRAKSTHLGKWRAWGGAGSLCTPKKVCLISFRLPCQWESFYTDFWDVRPQEGMTIPYPHLPTILHSRIWMYPKPQSLTL